VGVPFLDLFINANRICTKEDERVQKKLNLGVLEGGFALRKAKECCVG